MNSYSQIEEKLNQFLRKYYTNEILKGIILFLTMGLLYLLLTLAIEYFLWLKPMARQGLFWIFVAVEIGLFYKFIVVAIFKLIGLKKGLTYQKASQLIGKHFIEVNDQLTNLLQLKDQKGESDLLLASIEQKSQQLSPIPFQNAIDFKDNKKYLKYLAIPLVLWIIIFISDRDLKFSKSFDRVVHYNMAFTPPAPFVFNVLNDRLTVEEGKHYTLKVMTTGNVVPEQMKVIFNNQAFFLQAKVGGHFEYTFNNIEQNISFELEANGYKSIPYQITVLNTPQIISFNMRVDYPAYTKRKNESIENTGNLTVPEGTKVVWDLEAKDTEFITFLWLDGQSNLINTDTLSNSASVSKMAPFSIEKRLNKSLRYTLAASNINWNDYEKLSYNIKIIKDAYPKIKVKSNIDSVGYGSVQFMGQVSDDYGVSHLNVVAVNQNTQKPQLKKIEIQAKDFDRFFYLFPNGLNLEEGAAYDIYFEVYDNDAVNGRKSTRSEVFKYLHKTKEQIQEQQLIEQKETFEYLENNTEKSQQVQEQLDRLSDKLKHKSKSDWQDEKEIKAFLERQKQYKKMLERNTEKLMHNLEEMDEDENGELEEIKNDLLERMNESKDMLEKEDLLNELEQLTEKLKKEDLLDKMDKLSEKSKQESKTLERILELTKRFYIEKKSKQIANKLEQLSKLQDSLSGIKENTLSDQKKLNAKMDSIQSEFSELRQMNESLKQQMSLPKTKSDEDLIKLEMQEAVEELKKSEQSKDSQGSQKSRDKQKSAARKMKELQHKLDQSMKQMKMETLNEDIDNLQQILKNLILFSKEQEELMLSFDLESGDKADYPAKLKRQQVLKEHFEHIDDSLYTLSLRMVKMSAKIQEDLTNAHYNIDKALENIADNRVSKGISNQRYTMIAANNLADFLSDVLQSLQNKKMGQGQGKGKAGEELSLPDIIKQQQSLQNKMKEGMGKQQKGSEPNQEEMSGTLFEIYKEQHAIRQSLEQLIKNNGESGKKAKQALDQMETLERELLESGISKSTLERMRQLEHKMLKLETALRQQNNSNDRESTTGSDFNIKSSKLLELEKDFFEQQEMLQREELPLQDDYQQRVDNYFKKGE